MIDASHIKVHSAAAGSRGGNQEIGRTKGGSIQSYILAVDGCGRPVRVLITEGAVGDCKQGSRLIEGIDVQCLLSDKCYDTDEILDKAKNQYMKIVMK